MQDGEEKRRYELKIAVRSNEVNDFVNSLSTNYNELSLANIAYENKGGLTIVSLTYGDAAFIDGDELMWATMSNGVKSLHWKKKVDNNLDSINAFIAACQTKFGITYKPSEISVSCSPQIGEEKTWCEAVFTKANQDVDGEDDDFGDDNGGSGGDTGEDEEEEIPEETIKETGVSVQMSSSLVTIPIPLRNYLNSVVGKSVSDGLISMARTVMAGKASWVKADTYGKGKPAKDGWIKNEGKHNLNAINISAAWTSTYALEDVEKCIKGMTSIPSFTIPMVRVAVTTTVKTTNKDKLGQMNDFSEVGAATPEIKAGDFSMGIPEGLQTAKDPEGNEYPVITEWVNEGVSFDVSEMAEKTTRGGVTYYEGKVTRSWVTRSYIEPMTDDTEGG